ncbi:leucine-rich repeat domain-containing protein [Bacteroides sp. 519]|uniref:leucine-rich repeat domain-containing protein n=1 Tax=Bacteroides sp. 519 TaxID=2302937 RepID=UPI0013D794CF|nr:leucine-rich repeat domain-containing protein [Bacteroides sp. 519]NDV59705.1 leucine-rich repeat domain-containing protein [Bacteroides sp. 519]
MKKIFLTSILLIVIITGKLAAQTGDTVRVYVDKAGTLINNFTEEQANKIVHLTVTGKINAIDFKHLRNGFKQLEVLDISNAQIRMYTGKEGTHHDNFYLYPQNCIPAYAFSTKVGEKITGKQSLRHIILSEKIKNIENNAFMGCTNLKILQIIKKTPPNLFDGALADNTTAVFVPLGCRDEYRFNKRWGTFTLLEGNPVFADIQIGTFENLRDVLQKSGYKPTDIHYLTIEGKLEDTDFLLMRDYMPNLISIDISNTSATHIPDFVFSHKKYLMAIKLPQNLQSIGQRAFSNCEKLMGEIILPPTVNRIDFGAFMGCGNLKKVIVTGDHPTTLGDNLFGDENSKLKIN